MSARRAGFREAAPPPSSRTQRGGARSLHTHIALAHGRLWRLFSVPTAPANVRSRGGENGLNTDMPPLAESNPLRTSAVNEDAP
jgi:hypothetical protein